MKKVLQDEQLRTVIDILGREADTPRALEYRFHPVRRWRFDAAFPERLLGIEIDGGAFIQGRHTRGVGFKNDCEKLNMAALMGWRVFRFLPQQLKSGEVYNVLSAALGLVKEKTG